MRLPLRSARAYLRTTALREPWVWYRHRGLRENDVFIASYPKSGNTWLRFMLGQLLMQQEMDFDLAKPLIPIVGLHHNAPALLAGDGRIIKTHEPYRGVYRKAIYLVRDMRDVAVSYYYHQARQGLFHEDVRAFVAQFLAGSVDGLTRWDAHVRSWLESPLAQRDALHLVHYEQLRLNPHAVLSGITQFLGLEPTDEQIANVIAANSLRRMKEKEASATVLDVIRTDIPVVRSGMTGEWKTVLTDEEKQRFLDLAGRELGRLGYEVANDDWTSRSAPRN
jgi:hypothetical protein